MVVEKIKIGVSACLLGKEVRFNAQHKYHWYINEILGKYFDYVPICPEVAIGMGVPRKSVRLVGHSDSPEMIEPISGKNWTEKMVSYSEKKVKNFGDLSGFLFKRASPTCGVFRVKVYQKNGIPLPEGMGLFSQKVSQEWPLLPIEEEGRLNDTMLRENFLERVFGYQRIRKLMEKKFQRKDWIDFHTQNKFLLLAHSRKYYTELGHLVSAIEKKSPMDFKQEYSVLYMEALAVQTTRKKHGDVLLHILGFLKKILTKEQKEDILKAIKNYTESVYPLIVPMTLLNHYITLNKIDYIQKQIYLCPTPEDLCLRNHT